MDTEADKATHFLDHVIQSLVTFGIGDDFFKVMEDSEYDNVKELAELIRCKLGRLPTGYLM